MTNYDKYFGTPEAAAKTTEIVCADKASFDDSQWEAANPALAMRLGDAATNLESILPTHSELYIQHLKEVGE